MSPLSSCGRGVAREGQPGAFTRESRKGTHLDRERDGASGRDVAAPGRRRVLRVDGQDGVLGGAQRARGGQRTLSLATTVDRARTGSTSSCPPGLRGDGRSAKVSESAGESESRKPGGRTTAAGQVEGGTGISRAIAGVGGGASETHGPDRVGRRAAVPRDALVGAGVEAGRLRGRREGGREGEGGQLPSAQGEGGAAATDGRVNRQGSLGEDAELVKSLTLNFSPLRPSSASAFHVSVPASGASPTRALDDPPGVVSRDAQSARTLLSASDRQAPEGHRPRARPFLGDFDAGRDEGQGARSFWGTVKGAHVQLSAGARGDRARVKLVTAARQHQQRGAQASRASAATLAGQESDGRRGEQQACPFGRGPPPFVVAGRYSGAGRWP